MLQRKAGASIADLMKVTNWQKQSVYGLMSGTLRKKRKLSITTSKNENKDRRYFIGPAEQ